MDIIYYGNDPWKDNPSFRKQIFAEYLSKRGHRILYIQRDPKRKFGNRIVNFFTNRSLIRKSDNFYLYYRPENFRGHTYFIFINKLYFWLLSIKIKKIKNKLGFKDSIVWFCFPDFSMSLKYFKGHIKIMDSCDDIPFYLKLAGNEHRFRKMLYLYIKSIKESNIQIASAYKIAEKYQQYSKNEIIVAPNGHNIDLLKIRFHDTPNELRNISHPIIGFIGKLFHFLDDEVIRYIVKKRPNYNFVFVGGIEKNYPSRELLKYPNVYYLGRKPKNEIGRYIQSFNVCINPFKVHEVNDSVNPIKIYEYLAYGKAVVSTQMYSLQKEKVAPYIYFANSKCEFLDTIDNILENKMYKNKIPQSVLKEYYWENIFNNMVNKINKRFGLQL